MSEESPFSWANLPEACIAHILSFTSPRDACRLSLVSSAFRSAAESDALWDSFLPPEYASILSRSSASLFFPSKKHLYLGLSDKPLLIDDGLKSFHLDKYNGKKCYMLSAWSLTIIWGCTPKYWTWTSMPVARFEEVAELVNVCWLEIRGCINTRMLSPSTMYAAYLVFNFNAGAHGFEYQPVDVSVGIPGSDRDTHWRRVYLNTERRRKPRFHYFRNPPAENLDLPCPTQRSDGWLEIELGEFFNEGEDGDELQMAVYEIKGGHWKRGLIIQGIEIRPPMWCAFLATY